MRVLTINCGSSTLKFDVLDVPTLEPGAVSIARGIVDRIGGDSVASLSTDGDAREIRKAARDHSEAFALAVGMLEEARLLSDIKAVGHRVVHGGSRFREPVVIEADVIDAIAAAGDLAPLHNQPALAAIRAARAHFGEAVPMVATFDTAYFASLPDVAARYALPTDLSQRLGIRRFGFHGLAHRYMVERFRTLRPEIPEPRLITLQLGNGCSVTASRDGAAVDTSMGFTPLEGLIMGTRSGDLDPAIPLYLLEREGMSTQEVEEVLNKRSGLLGISGKTNDMRELLAAAADGDGGAEFAVSAFCYRAKKYVGAYLAALGGAHAVIFGGGIGENAAQIRAAICADFEWAGLSLDQARNTKASQVDERISADDASIEAWVVRVDEAAAIASDVIKCLDKRRR